MIYCTWDNVGRVCSALYCGESAVGESIKWRRSRSYREETLR